MRHLVNIALFVIITVFVQAKQNNCIENQIQQFSDQSVFLSNESTFDSGTKLSGIEYEEEDQELILFYLSDYQNRQESAHHNRYKIPRFPNKVYFNSSQLWLRQTSDSSPPLFNLI